MKKSSNKPKQPEPKRQLEPKRQPEKAPEAQKTPTQDSLPPPLALPDTQSVILDELIYLRQMMISHFDQMDKRINDLENTMDAMFDEVQEICVMVDSC